MYKVIYDLLEKHNYRLDYETLFSAVADKNEARPFDDDEIFSINDCITKAIVLKLASLQNPIEKRTLLESCVRTLQMTEVYDFDELYSEISMVHRILEEESPEKYSACDEYTKRTIRSEIYAYARKHGISDVEAAELYTKRGERGFSPTLGVIYFLLIAFFTSILWTLAAALCDILPALLLSLPIFALSKQMAEWIFARFVRPKPIHKLKIEKVPENAKTLVVITTLLTGGESDDALFARLEKMYFQNQGENVRFGILGDLKDSKELHDEKDDEVINHAREKIEKLNEKYGNNFFLFIRHRVFSSTQKCYIGYERKRGALLELVRAIKGKETTFSTFICDKDFLTNTKYIITLDADTNLYIGAVCELVGAMLHPKNKPVINRKVVVRGFGVMQPRMTTSLESAAATAFSVMITGAGGVDHYNNASFDFYQTIFNKGVFCGKGIFDVDAYYETLDDTYPDEKILSHDLLEGTRLRAGYLSELSLTDSCPKNPISWFTRLHRWIRGDIQAAVFAKKYVKDKDGKTIRNPIGTVSKYMLWDNVRIALTPVFSVISLLVALLYPQRVANIILGFSIMYLLFPSIVAFLSQLKYIGRRFYSKVLPGIWHSTCNALYNVSSLFYLCQISFDATIRALFRINVSKGKMLEWVTAAESEKKIKNGFLLYIRKMYLSVVVGFLLIAFAPHGLYGLLGVFWFFCPLASYLLSKSFNYKRQISGAKKAQLIRYARDIWSYFEDFVTKEDNYLPPDNYQISPVEVVAHRTSPTNIGMYMLSVVAAVDFGFISPDEMYERLSKTMTTIEKMPKYKGHLYNWYDTKTLEILGVPYISTVDSGNLVTSLIAISAAIDKYIEDEHRKTVLKQRINKFIEECDFSFLYNKNRELFAIGFDTIRGERSENCYDLIMSEARTTSYYAIASGIAKKSHWSKLSRPLISKNGHIGVASWSGTAFEYFMPCMLLPIYENSFMFEALSFCLSEQVRSSLNGIWGRSESGYFAFDNEMNYQYRAFGAKDLAMDISSQNEQVFSPYSSFLSLAIASSLPLANLAKLKEMGMYGKYGFYEALDLTPSRVGGGKAIIRSFMAHHLGMSMVSAANACFDDIFCKRFLSNPKMNAASELLQEQVPVNAPASRNRYRKAPPKIKYKRIVLPEDIFENNSLETTKCTVISNGKTKVYASSDGHIALFDERIALSYPFFTENSNLRTLSLYYKADDKVYKAFSDGGVQRFCYSGEHIKYVLVNDDNIKTECEITVHGAHTAVNIRLDISGQFKTVCPMLVFEPIMNKILDFTAHPSYNGLLIECEYIAEHNILIYKRRSRDGKKDLYLGVCMSGRDFVFISRRDEMLPLMYDEEDIKNLLNLPFRNSEGACIMPYCAVKRCSTTDRGRYVCDFQIIYAKSKKDLLNTMLEILYKDGKKVKNLTAAFRESLSNTSQNQLFTAKMSPSDMKYAEFILNCVLYDTRQEFTEFQADIGDLWGTGVSGDLPCITLSICGSEYLEEAQKKIICCFAKGHKYLSAKGFKTDLIILINEIEQYNAPIRRALLNSLREIGVYPAGKKGGVHILHTSNELASIFRGISNIFIETTPHTIFENVYFEYMRQRKALCDIRGKVITKIQHTITDETQQGFLEDEYLIIKGKQRNPWTYVYASEQFGTLLSQNSLGYTWFLNSGEFRLTPWTSDPLLDNRGERLILYIDDKYYDLCAVSNKVSYGRGYATYYGRISDVEYNIKVGCDPKLPVKLVLCEFINNGKEKDIRLDYKVTAWLGGTRRGVIYKNVDGDTTFYKNCLRYDKGRFGMFVSSFNVPKKLGSGDVARCHFLLGSINYANDRSFYYVLDKFIEPENVTLAFERYKQRVERLISQFKLDCDNRKIAELFNFYAPYQALYVRFYARSGFYQSSGAYGFRDQLQDALGLIPLNKNHAKLQIIRSAAHQFIEGDVQHWWHTTRRSGSSPDGYPLTGDRGCRTLCSDDYLWMPFVVAEYVNMTGDYDILDIQVRYIESKPLWGDEQERYEIPFRSEHKETIYMHCIRAIEKTLARLGEKGLPLIGTCDWNDGFSMVGHKGKGESVWLAYFYRLVLRKFIPICERKGDIEGANKYRLAEERMKEQIEKYCFDNNQYIRAFYDDGTPLGKFDNDECKIDLLPQAFSAILDGENKRSELALESAYKNLWDSKNSLMKLFTPPFAESEKNPGYIKSYVRGIRENGGQYTHGALFGIWGFFAGGQYDRAFEILSGITPVDRGENYRTEPYAFCGDVYTNPEHMGRGGWSQYTGAAAWFYRIVLNELLGYREHEGKYFTINPRLCKGFENFTLDVKKFDTIYHIEAAFDESDSVELDGVVLKNGENAFYFDKKEHFLKINVAKKEKR